MGFELSTYQKNIIDTFKNTTDNIFIDALAGSAKTYMLIEISKLIDDYSVFMAFNKSIQLELENKISNPKFKTYTFNGLGYLIMIKNCESKKLSISIDKYKTANIVKKVLSENYYGFKEKKWDIQKKYIDEISSLYEFCKVKYCEIKEENIKFIIKNYDLFSDNEIEVPKEIVKYLKYIDKLNFVAFEKDGILSFSDQLYITLKKLELKEWTVPPYLLFNHILVDECLPGSTRIKTENGLVQMSKLYKLYSDGDKLPKVKSYNQEKDTFEYKQVLNVKKHDNRSVFEITTEGLNKIQATDNHKFLTQRGYVKVSDLIIGKDILMLDSSEKQKSKIGLNDDQLQLALASGIGDGYLQKMSKFNTYRITLTQGEAQLKYLEFKAKMLNCNKIRKYKMSKFIEEQVKKLRESQIQPVRSRVMFNGDFNGEMEALI